MNVFAAVQNIHVSKREVSITFPQDRENFIIRLFAWDAEKHQFKPSVSNKCVYTNYDTQPHSWAASGQTDRSTHLSFQRLSVRLAQMRQFRRLYLMIVSKLSAPSHWAIYGSVGGGSFSLLLPSAFW